MNAQKDFDTNVALALISQVSKAVPKGKDERHVVTYVSQAMWVVWCRFIKEPPGPPSKHWSPTCRRIFGSRTVVVQKEGMWSYSKADEKAGS